MVKEQMLDAFRASTRRWLVGSFRGWATMLLCLVGIGFVIIAVQWWRNISTRYEVSDQRIIIHQGIIIKSTDEIELFRIKDLRVNYSIINQMADIGTITLTTSDKTADGHEFIMPCIPAARRRRDELRQLVDAARQQRRVRELDLDYDMA